jgi:hypothetical protein
MKFPFSLAAVVALSLSATPALALDGILIALPGLPTVIVWQDAEAQSQGLQLIEAGVLENNPELLIPLLACLVPSGTKAIITDAGLATHDIMVIDGEHAGCKGNIAMESWQSN